MYLFIITVYLFVSIYCYCGYVYIVVNYIFYLKLYCRYVYDVCKMMAHWKSWYTTWHGYRQEIKLLLTYLQWHAFTMHTYQTLPTHAGACHNLYTMWTPNVCARARKPTLWLFLMCRYWQYRFGKAGFSRQNNDAHCSYVTRCSCCRREQREVHCGRWVILSPMVERRPWRHLQYRPRNDNHWRIRYYFCYCLGCHLAVEILDVPINMLLAQNIFRKYSRV